LLRVDSAESIDPTIRDGGASHEDPWTPPLRLASMSAEIPMRPAVLVLLALLASAAPADPDPREQVAEFRRNFAPGMNRLTRENAIQALASIPDEIAADAFVWGLGLTATRVRDLAVERDDTREELRKLEKQLVDVQQRAVEEARRAGWPPPEQIPVPASLLEAQRAARAKVDRLQGEIDTEYEIRESLAHAEGAWLTGLPEKPRVLALKDLERRGLRDRDWLVRAFHAEALGHAQLPEATRLLLLRLAEEAAARQAGETALPDLLRLLEDPRWQIRVAVVAALATIGSPEAIEPLIERLAVEPGRLRGDIADALKALTGQDLGISAERWRTWWAANRDRFVRPAGGEAPAGPPAAPEGEPEAGVPSFYGIRIVSQSILFVIDISGSMNEPVTPQDPARTKILVAKYELRNAILALSKEARFNIVFYSLEVHQWRKGMVQAGDREKRAAVEFVEAMTADGATNIYGALERAFHVVGMGSRDKNYELGADTIFFLSDGKPTVGDVLDTTQILNAVRRWNELRRVKVHAVGVGGDHDAAFMRELADSSGGVYVNR
jgi:HEAT repeat protein/uncharacterized protein YegL